MTMVSDHIEPDTRERILVVAERLFRQIGYQKTTVADIAKERGVRFGRPRKLTPHQRQEALARLEAGETQADVARTYNVDATTIGRLQPRLSMA